MKLFTIILFTIFGWKLQGEMPANIKKCIIVGAPHTSNFDLIFAMAGFYKLKLPIRFLIKKDWLRHFPLKNILLSAGALGIDRSKNNTMVDNLANLIATSKENMAILISPEGTRKHACKWKTGFYYTALKAKIPIVLSHLDYSKKMAVLGPSFMPSGSFKKDMQILRDYYKNIVPKYPENFCLEIYLEDKKEYCRA
ncbi:MAG: 1-acyl-sn-glycerol-3-phosphate acyltransferase [Bacillota bacterium]